MCTESFEITNLLLKLKKIAGFGWLIERKIQRGSLNESGAENGGLNSPTYLQNGSTQSPPLY